MSRLVRTAAVVGLACLIGVAARGQGRQTTDPITGQPAGQTTGRGSLSNPPQLPNPTPTLNSSGAEEAARDRTSRMAVEQEKARNTDRQRRLVSDTERLVALANELKSDVDKSSKDTMSLEVIRKADEIEKLARSVKEKMKGT